MVEKMKVTLPSYAETLLKHVGELDYVKNQYDFVVYILDQDYYYSDFEEVGKKTTSWIRSDPSNIKAICEAFTAKNPSKVPEVVDYFIKNAFDDEDEALRRLIIASSGDYYQFKQDYEEWLRINDLQTGITEFGMDQIINWLSEQNSHTLMDMIRERE